MNPQLQALRNGDLAGARELRISDLDEFPREIFELADSLEVLDLSGGALTDLPDDFGRLRKLRILFCSGNAFERLPPALGGCPSLSQIGFRKTGLQEIPGESLPPSLRWLTLTDNAIEQLPTELGERPRLQKLMLAGNRLHSLPESLAGARNLELVRLSANRFEALPRFLLELPRLAWISWAGNPLERRLASARAVDARWDDLAVGEQIGEGASGVVHRALWRSASDAARPVALKLFKGAMTSDGSPDCEIAACLASGDHPHLTAALGRVTDHPDGLQALLMPLLSADWKTLAGPPSLSSCSRDVYDAQFAISGAKAHRIAESIAGAAAHLHDCGLLHGDLYAHNITWDERTADCVLGDFGAACVLPSGADSDAWQRVEVRAFGVLLGELLDRADETSLPRASALRALQQDCVRPLASQRPSMLDVVAALRDICP
ncbi:MAG: protein kinase [Hyphomicrobiales bacterium]|nr:protein kinase [Hyphomicrobiales bacterium]